MDIPGSHDADNSNGTSSFMTIRNGGSSAAAAIPHDQASDADSFSWHPRSVNAAASTTDLGPTSNDTRRSGRPKAGLRSVSYSAGRSDAQGPSRVSSTFQRVTSEFRRLTRQTSPQDPEWSVFGQLMESESRVPPPPPLIERGSSRTLARLETAPTRRKKTMLSSEGDPDRPRMQSPVSDPGLDSGWPPEVPHEHQPETSSFSSEDESDRSTDSPTDGDASANPKPKVPWYSASRIPSLSPLQRNILKCSIAYFIASLFTYNSYLSGLITKVTLDGPQEWYPSPSGHMVATVAVYFNPAKTIGGMLEADKYCLMGLAFAAFISLGSMNVFWWLEVKHGWEWLADVLAILWIGIGMSLVAWTKVWMAKPTFNTACSMTAIILFVVVVKEGGVETLLQVSFIIFLGSVVSNLVCYSIWPQYATVNLQTTMVKTLDSYSTLLKLLTSTFLLEEPMHHPSQEKIQKAVADHQASFTSLKKNLGEAQSESLWSGLSGRSGPSGVAEAPYDDAVDSLNRLAQHLNGLRSGTSLQYELATAHKDGKITIKSKVFSARNNTSQRPGSVAEINNKGKSTTEVLNDDAVIMLSAAASMFGDLVDELGPPLKALSVLSRRLREAPFAESNNTRTKAIEPRDFVELATQIERALYTFESTSNHAVLRLYRRSDMSGITSRASVTSVVDDNVVVTGGDNESIFLVYFFIFTLQEFALELVSLVDAMGRIYAVERAKANKQWWFKRIPKKLFSCLRTKEEPNPSARQQKRPGPSGLKRLSSFIKSGRPHIASSFPKIRPHAPNTVQTPAWDSLSLWGKVKWLLWSLGGRMRERDIKYAVKAGMATAILAAPAFFDATRPVFMEYRGEWALISFFVVMSPTIGATNFLSVHRVLGTFFGAATAALVYTLFPEDPIALSLFGFFYSIPCFYYIVAKPEYATTGRFVLLTYNLSCLYCYNVRQKDVMVTSIAFHRSVAVTIGVVWAAFVSRFWWPAEARRELSKALGDFCLNIGWLYTRLVAANSFSPEVLDEDEPENATENTALIPRRPKTVLNNSIEQFMAMEFHLQVKLIELQTLLKQTQHEPRLKGPFPIKLYRSILTSLQAILDKLHSMRCVTTREEWYTDVRRDFILPVNKERREMVGNIILYFYTLGSAFRLKAPLPPYLPPAEKARQHLVDAIRKLDVVKHRDIKGSRQLLFFAYALTMRGITQELDFLGHTSQEAFGVIGQSVESFDQLFEDEEREDGNFV
ncbi:hypothetical protein EVG20_g1380 [Dentipellis fragilis]|uniref:Uncharacterized protein n=1 Tax=Dentipellis fragilis TaxID=205917 RepID=A0A4Y9ZDZ6_9AGAM|nr:hypothetical protein EVG20_g1380 [Dentipellis fragilis]